MSRCTWNSCGWCGACSASWERDEDEDPAEVWCVTCGAVLVEPTGEGCASCTLLRLAEHDHHTTTTPPRHDQEPPW